MKTYRVEIYKNGVLDLAVEHVTRQYADRLVSIAGLNNSCMTEE